MPPPQYRGEGYYGDDRQGYGPAQGGAYGEFQRVDEVARPYGQGLLSFPYDSVHLTWGRHPDQGEAPHQPGAARADHHYSPQHTRFNGDRDSHAGEQGDPHVARKPLRFGDRYVKHGTRRDGERMGTNEPEPHVALAADSSGPKRHMVATSNKDLGTSASSTGARGAIASGSAVSGSIGGQRRFSASGKKGHVPASAPHHPSDKYSICHPAPNVKGGARHATVQHPVPAVDQYSIYSAAQSVEQAAAHKSDQSVNVSAHRCDPYALHCSHCDATHNSTDNPVKNHSDKQPEAQASLTHHPKPAAPPAKAPSGVVSAAKKKKKKKKWADAAVAGYYDRQKRRENKAYADRHAGEHD